MKQVLIPPAMTLIVVVALIATRPTLQYMLHFSAKGIQVEIVDTSQVNKTVTFVIPPRFTFSPIDVLITVHGPDMDYTHIVKGVTQLLDNPKSYMIRLAFDVGGKQSLAWVEFTKDQTATVVVTMRDNTVRAKSKEDK